MIKIKSTGHAPLMEMDDEEYTSVCVDIPTDSDTATSFELGDKVTVTLKGKVKEVRASKSEYNYGAPGHLELELESLEVDGKNAFADLVDGEIR